MSLASEIIIVSGLPRTGTSLMMQMLDRGGIPAVTDAIRGADRDNPRGYYEFERVKKTRQDPSWLPDARGKVVKMVSSLLYDLPATETYRIVFMERDMEEVMESQEKMLTRLGRAAAPRDQIRKSFGVHLERLFAWLPTQRHMSVLRVSYNDLLAEPEPVCRRIAAFLGDVASAAEMCGAIDVSLYRNRAAAVSTG